MTLCIIFIVINMLLTWWFCVIVVTQAQDKPRVKTSQGWVVGRKAVDGDYLDFYGIPYAGPTSGPNRFKPPTPPQKHTEDFQAIDNDIACAQPSQPRGSIIGVEDCLVLSIHTRNLTTAKPVFVWLDGEDYETTSKKKIYSYKSLVMEDLVVVSINYRLSIFGFLCLRVPEAPGNVGLKDVVQGLKWIRENIAGFGGDANNIMLVGHGSGAAMVDLITLSPMSKNLVHKAVALSGSALSPWAVAYEPIQYAKAAAARIIPGVTRSKLDEILYLLNIDIYSLIASSSLELYNASLVFAPCIESDNNPDISFLSKSPIEILRSGDYDHIPYIAGYTNREGTIRQKMCKEWIEKMQNNFTNFLPLDLDFYSIENKIAIGNNIKEQYFKSENINMENLDKYFDYHGDVLINIPVLRAAQERAKTSKENVRLFEFACDDTTDSDSTFDSSMRSNKGAGHDALPKFLFGYDLKSDDVYAIKSIIDIFTGFAYSGKPFRSPNKTLIWLPVTEESLNKLYISGGITDGGTKYSERLVQENGTSKLFWDIILQLYYRAPAVPIEIITSAASYSAGFTVRTIFLYVFLQILRILFS